MSREVNDDYNQREPEQSWENANLLARGAVALGDLFGLYETLCSQYIPSPSASEATSLMRPCNGSKRSSVAKGWAGG